MSDSIQSKSNVALATVGAIGIAGVGLAIGSLGQTAAVLLVVPIFAIVLLYPIVGILALVLAVPFEAAVMLGGVTATRAIGLLVATAWIMRKLFRREPLKPILSQAVVLAAILLMAYALASIMWATYPVPVVSEFLRLAMLLSLAVLVLDIISSWDRLDWLVTVLVIGAAFAAALTIAQYFGAGVRRAGADIAGGINATSYVLVSILPFGFYLARCSGRYLARLLGLASVALTVIAVSVTFSRMSFLLVPLIVGAEYWETIRARRGRTALAVVSVIAVVVGLRFVPLESVQERAATIIPYIESTLSENSKADNTVSGRGYHIRVALAIMQDYPLLGSGYQNYGPHFLQYQRHVPGSSILYSNPRSAHGSHYQVAAELGVVGMLIWIGLWGVGARNLKVAWRRLTRQRRSREFLLTRAVVLCFFLQFIYGFYDDIHIDKLFWLVLGMTVAVYWISGRDSLAREDASLVDDPGAVPILRKSTFPV